MIWLLIGYMFLFIHRPFEVWPALGTFRIELCYMLVAGSLWALSPNKRWLANPLHLAYSAFACSLVLCWLASPWSERGQLTVENYFKILVFYLMIVTVVHDEQTLKRLSLGFLVVMFLYMAHSFWEYRNGRHVYRMGICRMIGVDTSLSDPNSFGASIVFALPFVLPFWQSQPSRKLRCFLIAYVALSVVCIGLTGSRGSFLGLVVWGLLVLLRSRQRWKLAALAVVAVPLLWGALPPSLQTRFETIINPEVGPANAIESGNARIEAWGTGLELLANNPATGCGPGAWRKATGWRVESHNLYGQVMGEMGGLGVLTFGAILLLYWRNLRQVSASYRQHPEWGQDFLYYLSRSIGFAFFLMLFEGTMGHNLFRFSWLWYGGFLIIARHCVEQRLASIPAFEPAWPSWGPSTISQGRPFGWIGTHS